jgi:6-phosphogluconolactonase
MKPTNYFLTANGPTDMELKRFSDSEQMARFTADLTVETAIDAATSRGVFSFCLSGGRTPERLYELLAQPPWADQMPWDRTHLFWGDDRAVPPDHPDSNFKTAYDALLAKIPLADAQVHRIPGEVRPLSDAASRYEADLRGFFDTQEEGGLPRFDLVLLGVGPDGHTASLFPHAPTLDETENLVAAVDAPDHIGPHLPRLTLTLPMFNSARLVVFLITGKDKQDVVRRIVEQPDAARADFPAARVRPFGLLWWLVDDDAWGD